MTNDGIREAEEGELANIFVSRNCISCGSCAAIAPETFELWTDGAYSQTFRKRVSEDDVYARAACPVGAITIVSGSFVKAHVSESSLRSAVKAAKERISSGTLNDFGKANAERAVEECSALLEGFVLRP